MWFMALIGDMGMELPQFAHRARLRERRGHSIGATTMSRDAPGAIGTWIDPRTAPGSA